MTFHVMKNQAGSSVDQPTSSNDSYFRTARLKSLPFKFEEWDSVSRHIAEVANVEPTSLHNRNFAELPEPLEECGINSSFGERMLSLNPADILCAGTYTRLVVTIRRQIRKKCHRSLIANVLTLIEQQSIFRCNTTHR